MSFGVEGVAGWGPVVPAAEVVAFAAEAGYSGIELGPWGYLGTDARDLRRLLQPQGLDLMAAFVALNLHDGDAWQEDLPQLERVASLLCDLRAQRILISDSGYEDVSRADEVWPRGGAQWMHCLEGVSAAAAMCRRYGLEADLHPEVGSCIGTKDQIETVLERTAPDVLGLCLDTGHLVYSGMDPLEALRIWKNRIRHVHLKDVCLPVLDFVRRHRLDFAGAVARGVFVPLGTGDVPCAQIVQTLEQMRYEGWLIVEQDVILRPWDDPQSWARSARVLLQRLGY